MTEEQCIEKATLLLEEGGSLAESSAALGYISLAQYYASKRSDATMRAALAELAAEEELQS